MDECVTILLADGPAVCFGLVIEFPTKTIPKAVSCDIQTSEPCICDEPNCSGGASRIVTAHYSLGTDLAGKQMMNQGLPCYFFDGWSR